MALSQNVLPSTQDISSANVGDATNKLQSVKDKIPSIRENASQKVDAISDIQENVASSIKDPFGAIIRKVLTKIGGLTANVESKVNDLATKAVKSANNKGNVTLQGNNIVITVEASQYQEAVNTKADIENKIAIIQKTLNTLELTLKSLEAIQTAITALDTALTIQEITLSSNPASGPVYQVLKQGIKLIFLKDIIKEYSNVLKKQLKQNLKSFDRISDKFKNLRVSVVVQNENNNGNSISNFEAEKMIADNLLNTNTPTEENNAERITEDFVSNNNIEYILKVEKYGEDRLIAIAYDKESGFVKQQTSPSYFATSEELLEELKTILNVEL